MMRMKKKICAVMSAVLALNGAAVFGEEEKKAWKAASTWAEETLAYAQTLSIYPECFETADLTVNVTRAEFAEVTVAMYEAITGNTVKGTQNPFADTDNSFVLAAYQLGIIQGVSETEFAPLDELTREAAAVMLSRTYDVCFPENEKTESGDGKFSDDAEISDWAYDAVYSMSARGYIKGTDKGFLPKSDCTREQALAIAARMVNDVRGGGEIGAPTDPTGENNYVIAYIGGSLTEGGANWQSKVTNYIKEQMPDKNVVAYRAGIGGTGSEYCAVRYYENVLSKNPDLVFIDAAVNDAQGGEVTDAAPHQKSMESMIRQSLSSEKVPAIVFIYMPQPAEKTADVYKATRFSADSKEKLAKHYGIESVYIDDYLFEKYQSEGKGTAYTQWLGNYYNVSGTGYDVHPKSAGYSMYGDAIVAAFEERGLDGFIKPVEDKGIFCVSEKETVLASYNYIRVGDERLSLDENWKIYEKYEDASNEAPSEKYYSYPFFEDGLWHSVQKGAAMTLKTKADKLIISYISHTEGNVCNVYVDGKKSGEVKTTSVYNNMNYTGSISLPGDGKEHEVKIEAGEFGKPLDIGAVIEGFTK